MKMYQLKDLKPVVFQIQGERPGPEELERCSKLSFGSGLPGSAEVKDAIKWFCIGIIGAVFAFFFGRWVIKGFRGPGVLIFGYGMAYLAAPLSVIFGVSSLLKLFRPAHKTKADAAFKWTWLTSILGEDRAGERFGKLPYAVSTMSRLLPEGTDFRESVFENYVRSLRAAMSEAADETTAAQRTAGWNETAPDINCSITSDTEISPNLHELQATITFKDKLAHTVNNKTESMITAILELHITQSYIRSGKYWFPYNVTPAFTRVTTEEADA